MGNDKDHETMISALAGTEMKYCAKCKTLKPITEFHLNKSSKDGHHPVCKKCRSEEEKAKRQVYKDIFSKDMENIPVEPKRVGRPPKEVIKTADGRTLVKREVSDNKPLSQYTNREILEEIKRRGYEWTDMWIKQNIDYNKINCSTIIKTAHISRSTFYIYFKNKDQVVMHVCDDIFDHIFNRHLVKERNHDFSKDKPDELKHFITHSFYHFLEERETNVSEVEETVWRG